MKICGIDLAVPGKLKTGVAILKLSSRDVRVFTIDSTYVVDYLVNEKPFLVAIDAPLTRPKSGVNRLIEIKARRIGLKLLPPLMGGMRRLTEYGIEIKERLLKEGIKVVEVHPSSTLKILDMSRSAFLDYFRQNFHLENDVSNIDEIDALICLFTAHLYIDNNYTIITGEYNNEFLVIPKLGDKCKL